jgi:hypothetical protein
VGSGGAGAGTSRGVGKDGAMVAGARHMADEGDVGRAERKTEQGN